MRRWRVGTLSMGLVLVALGLLMIIARFNEKAVLDIVISWWPVILFLLGGEVLWFAYRAKEDSPKVKYDIFSIFIVGFIVMCSLGLYCLGEIGLLGELQKTMAAQGYVVQAPEQVFPVETDIKRIVVQTTQYPLTVRSTNESQVRVLCTADVTADSLSTAEKLLEGTKVMSTESGDTLYLSFNSVRWGGDLGYQGRIRSYTLLIPEGKDVEVENNSSLVLQADKLAGNWLVSGHGRVEVRLKEGNDLQVNVSSEDSLELGGNINWTEKNEEGPFQATFQAGSGKNKLNLIDPYEVNVYQIN
ncbi:MAG: hypothetical protein AAGU27_07050 [Dehalobacterium sp.]